MYCQGNSIEISIKSVTIMFPSTASRICESAAPYIHLHHRMRRVMSLPVPVYIYFDQLKFLRFDQILMQNTPLCAGWNFVERWSIYRIQGWAKVGNTAVIHTNKQLFSLPTAVLIHSIVKAYLTFDCIITYFCPPLYIIMIKIFRLRTFTSRKINVSQALILFKLDIFSNKSYVFLTNVN